MRYWDKQTESILTFEQRVTLWMSDQEMNTFQPGPTYWSQTYEWAHWNPVGGNLYQPPHHPQQYAGSRHWHCRWKENQKGEWKPSWKRDSATRGPDVQQANWGNCCPLPRSLQLYSDPPNPTSFDKEKTHGRAKGGKPMWNKSLYTPLFFQQILTEHLL